MTETDPSAPELLRAGLLKGASLMVARAVGVARGEHPPCFADAIAHECERLGASVARCDLTRAQDTEQATLDALARAEAVDLLAVDADSLFARAAEGASPHAGRAALQECMQCTWELTRALANAAFIERQRPGRILFVAPRDDGEQGELAQHARAARAALENLARTLSIEFSRYALTTVAIAPARRTSAQEVAALVAYLASPAGAYFSGCVMDLTGPAPASRASERAR